MLGMSAFSQSASAQLSGEIEIGSIIPLTGKLARSGEENKIGYELAVEHFNQYLADKDAGWSLSVVSEDSQTQPTVTLEKVQGLYAKGIQHVIGPQSSGNIQNIKGYVDANNIMIISPSSTSPLLATGGDSIFRLAPDDSNQAVALVRLLQDAGIDVIVPIWRDEAWGVGLERAIRDAFPAVGGTVHEGIPYSPEASDFSSEASVLAEIVQGYVDEHGADKVAVASFGFGETQILFQSAASHDILDDVKWFGADAVTKDTVIIDDPITLEFATTTEFTTLQVASGKNAQSKLVEEAVEEAIGRTPRTYASSAYDAIWLLGLSMERIQSTDVTQLTAVFPEVAAEHMGALGSTELNEHGDLAQVNYDVWTVSDGQWKQLGVYFALTDSVELEAMPDVMMEEKLSGEIEIGAIAPISGDLSNFGAENNAAHQIAIADFNAYLEDKGASWSLSLTTEDSQTLPTVALEKMQALHARGIQHVIGPESSGSLQNVKGYVDSNNILVISCCSTSPLLAIEGDSIFRTVPDDTNQAVAIAKLLESNGIDVVVPIWREDAWGVGLQDALRESVPALGGTVDDGFGYNPEASDFSTEASILADIVQGHVDENGAENVGVVYIAFGEAVLFFQSAQSHEILNEIRWFGADASAKDPRFIEDPLALEFSTNTEFTAVVVASGQNDISTHVDESVAATLGNTPTAYASASYDAVWILGLAMEATQSTDVDVLTKAIPDVAAERMGALGSDKLNAAGDLAQANYDIWAIVNEEWVFLGTYDAGSNSIIQVLVPPVVTPPDVTEPPEVVPPDDDGGCLIATATYGSELAPQVQFLREIRDNTLLSTASGTSFMTGFNQVYYSFSPAIADLERENPLFRDAVLALITPGLYTMNIMTFADPGSEVSILVFGMLSIAAIGGVYVAGPILAVHTVRKRISRRN